MAYQVTCGCGKVHAVTAGDAGALLWCECGKTVEVPQLHELRADTGEAVVSPAVAIKSLLLAGKLPGTSRCVLCDRETDGIVHVGIQCERAIVVSGATQNERGWGLYCSRFLGIGMCEASAARVD